MGERSERSERHREFGSDIKKSPESDGPAGRRGASHPDVRHPARASAPARRAAKLLCRFWRWSTGPATTAGAATRAGEQRTSRVM